jgi:hypothetical protein
MQHNGRRVIVAGWASAREMFANVTAERDQLRAELFEVTRHRDDILTALHELRAEVRTMRSQAEQRCRELYRERDIARARAQVRDPNAALN